MPLEQFFIQLENSSASFTPGQSVTGAVVIKTSTATTITDFQTRFKGKASVAWKGPTPVKGKQPSYNAIEVVLDIVENHIRHGTSELIILPGELVWPFSFHLPSKPSLPCSFVGTHGRIEYYLTASIKESSNINHFARESVLVHAIVDLANESNNIKPVDLKICKNNGCFPCTSGPVCLKVKLSKKGYYPGETFTFELEISNNSKRAIKDVSAKLIKIEKFRAKKKIRTTPPITIFTINRGRKIKSSASDMWHVEKVLGEDYPPSGLGGCKIIDVQYIFKIEAIDSANTKILEKQCPIVIGCLPATEEPIIKVERFIPSRPQSACSVTTQILTPIYQDSYTGNLLAPVSTSDTHPRSAGSRRSSLIP